MRNKLKYPVLILAMLLLVSSFSASFVHVAFSVNRTFIIKQLCENRSRPQMHCNGKCYLRKQLKQQQSQNAPANAQQNNTETLNWLFTGDVLMKLDNCMPATNPVSHFSDFLSIGFILSVDHPPPFIG